MPRCASALLLLPFSLLVVAGCHVNHQGNGKNENVDIGTPFGSMQVKTNEGVAAGDTGMTPYPGAVVEKRIKGDSDNAADINMSFGSFHLGVKVVRYQTADAPDKVMAFYRKDLAKYGAVLLCDGDRTVGEPARTAEGLTCADDNKGTRWTINNQSLDSKGGKMELRTGSKQHQHIVAVEKRDGGTRLSLVALDLPTNLELHDDDDKKTN